LGWWDGTTWAYILPDALGSVQQAADGAGVVVCAREWTPYGEEVGGWRAGLGYTGEWQDGDVGLVYLRARWYAPGVGIFTAPDPFPGVQAEPGSLHPYLYVLANPVNTRDPVESFKIVPGPSLKKSYLSRPRPGRTLARRKRSGETKADTVPIPEVLPLPSGPLSLPPEWADAREEDPLSAERPVPRSENVISTSCRAYLP
jgi:RHS repeat-associated protein